MKKINILFFILFFNICSGSESGVVSISENTTTTEIINEGDDILPLLQECGWQK